MAGENKIANFLKRRIDVSDEEAALFNEAFEEKQIRKKQLIVQPNYTAKYRYYVTEGALRSFIIDKSGHEVTIGLAIEDWWITDYNSYIYQQPATLFVEAITHSKVMQISYEKQQKLISQNNKFETLFRIMAEQGLASQQRRLIANLTQSAEERYAYFAQHYPQFLNLIPQYIIASFLGMSSEFLSKIRNNKLKKS